MPYSVTGHFVQVWQDAYVSREDVTFFDLKTVANVHGYRVIARQAQHAKWAGVKNALNFREAKKIAKTLRQNGFHSRVGIRTHDGVEYLVEYKPKRKDR